jgi:hypothetical protein
MTRIEPVIDPRVHTHGDVPAEATAYAVRKLRAALEHAPARVVSTWLVLDADAPGDRVAAHVLLGGAGIYVHAAGSTLQEATDLMQERLRARMSHLRRRHTQGPPAPPEPSPAEVADPTANA